jgi:hypothetical protein
VRVFIGSESGGSGSGLDLGGGTAGCR